MSDKTTTATAYATSLGAAAGSLTVNELVAVLGLALAVLTFLVNLIYRHLTYRLQKAAHDAETKRQKRH